MIEAINVTKIYRTGRGDLTAVDNARIAVREGDFALILGRSGSGKSTLLGMLAGLIHPTSGSIRIRGQDIGTFSDDQMSALRAGQVGFVFQFSGLLPTLTVIENVMVPTLFRGSRPDAWSSAQGLLTRVGLSERAFAYPKTLSSGEMKRVAIARALINHPVLLVADEPTGDLDVDTELEIMELFRQLNREGMTILMVTHSPDLASFGTRRFGMNRGVLIEHSGSDPVFGSGLP
jgi:ABC-type lipoprotein export system ATPase subunit